jgi:predicted transcriptional regulator
MEPVMSKEAVFTMKLETALRDQFMAEARTLDRPASQVMRDLMREFLRRQQEARDYRDFVHSKVEAAREDRQAGRGREHAAVEADFAARRAGLLGKSGA